MHTSDPPLCAAHARKNAGADPGAPRAGAPPGNTNARKHGFYSAVLDLSELADLVACAGDMTLDDEIACTRVLLRRLMDQIRDPLNLAAMSDDPAAYARLAGLAIQAARTVARLLRDKRALTGDAADGIAGAISQVLDELSTEWGVEL